jgi:hypothetical protein
LLIQGSKTLSDFGHAKVAQLCAKRNITIKLPNLWSSFLKDQARSLLSHVGHFSPEFHGFCATSDKAATITVYHHPTTKNGRKYLKQRPEMLGSTFHTRKSPDMM